MTDTPQDIEQQWQVTVRVPMRLPVEQRHELFSAVVKAVGEWEPSDRDGWDADISGEPRGAACLGERMLDWADTLLRQPPGSIPVGDVAWKLRDMVRAVVPPTPQDTPDIIEQATRLLAANQRSRYDQEHNAAHLTIGDFMSEAREDARALAAAGLLRTPEQQGETEPEPVQGLEYWSSHQFEGNWFEATYSTCAEMNERVAHLRAGGATCISYGARRVSPTNPTPDPHPLAGGNADRQSLGHPGHCADCVAVGHVVAHPGAQCSDVGCWVAHPAPTPDQEALMSLAYIRDYYGVPAKRGGRVRDYQGRLGTITGASGPHLRIRLDGERHSVPYHPTWRIEYLPTTPEETTDDA